MLFGILWRRWRLSAFGFAPFGQERLCFFNGGFTDALLPRENEYSAMINSGIQKAIYESGVIRKCDPKIADAITAVSGILPEWDSNLTSVLLRENGLMKRFDSYAVNGALKARRFFPRFEQLPVNRYIRLNGAYDGFERAVCEKLLAGQTAYFKYEGE